jgi:hypothetical protein
MDTMKRSFVLGAVLVATMGSVASAGVFGGLGIGTNGYSDDHSIYQTNGRSGRLFGGYRFAPFSQYFSVSAEAGYEGFGLAVNHSSTSVDSHEIYVAGKVSVPFAEGFEAFGRLGGQQTSVSATGVDSGSGYLYGAGLEYRLNLGGAITGSIFLDLTRTTMTLQADRPINSSVDRWMMGISVGI